MPVHEMFEEESEEVLGNDYLTVSDVARLMRMTERRVVQAIIREQLRAIRIGGEYRITKTDTVRFIETHQELYGAE